VGWSAVSDDIPLGCAAKVELLTLKLVRAAVASAPAFCSAAFASSTLHQCEVCMNRMLFPDNFLN
jgi:hypothetical protein